MSAWRPTVLALLSAGCTPTEGSLVDHDLWVWDTADPFSDDVSDDAGCADGAWGRFTDYLDVDTASDCTYLAVQQPSLARVRPGRQIRIQAWHGPLTSEAPAEGHLVVSLGDLVLLDQSIELPAEDTVYLQDVPVEHAVPADTPVRLHLHNHGDNTWAVRLVELVPES